MTKTIAQHKADGTYRQDRHGRRASVEMAGGATLRAPATLQPAMRPLWKKVIATLEPSWLATADSWLLVQLVEALYFQQDAAQRLTALGTVIKTINNDVHKSPYWMIWRQATENVRALSRQLGLSPADRARLAILAGDPAPDAGAVFEQLMRNHAAARVGDDDSTEAEEWE